MEASLRKHGGSMFLRELKRRTEPEAKESASLQRPEGDERTNPPIPTRSFYRYRVRYFDVETA